MPETLLPAVYARFMLLEAVRTGSFYDAPHSVEFYRVFPPRPVWAKSERFFRGRQSATAKGNRLNA